MTINKYEGVYKTEDNILNWLGSHQSTVEMKINYCYKSCIHISIVTQYQYTEIYYLSEQESLANANGSVRQR